MDALTVPLTRSASAFRIALLASVSTLTIATSALADALADADSATLTELTVTAERRTESILQAPVAVSAIKGDEFAAQHVERLSDLTARMPNVEISSPRGSSLTDVVIRGVGVANDFSVNQVSPVGAYVDDSYNASRVFAGAQTFDLDRVEVLRGPQGTLFGRNTTGGLINFITRRPGLSDDNGRIEAGYGNFNDLRLEGAYEHTFLPDVAGVRVAGRFERHDGFYHNVNPGLGDADDLNTGSARVEFRWKPAQALDITAKAYGHWEGNAQWNLRVKQVGASAETPGDRFGVDITPGRFKSAAAGGEVKAVVTLAADWTLTALSSYDRGRIKISALDLDGRTISPTTPGFTQESQSAQFGQVNEEARLAYDGTALKLIGGVYYGRDTLHDDDHYDLFTVFPVSPQFRYDQVRSSAAAFAQADWTAISDLKLTAGLRFTHDENSYRNGHADVAIPVVPGGLLNTLPGAGTPLCPAITCPTATEPDVTGKTDALTGRLAIKYRFSPSVMAYASYNHGYRGGAFNGLAYVSPAQLAVVKPETINAYEVGFKAGFLDGRAQVSAAAFYNDYRDQQVNFIRSEVTALGPLPINFLDNVPKATTKGLELEGQLIATDGLRLHAALGLLEADYGANAVVADQNLSGNRLPYSPRASGSAGFDWTLGRLWDGEVIFAPMVVYSGRYFFDPLNLADVSTRGFTRVNAMLTWAARPYTARLWTNNLFNEKSNTFAIDLRANTHNFAYVGAAPRTFGVSVSRDF